jgi:nucleoside-diphosphate-sugar epimerase
MDDVERGGAAGAETSTIGAVAALGRERRMTAGRLRVALSPAEALLCNVCTGVPTSIAELAERLMAVAKRSVPVSHVAARAGDTPASVGDPRRARELLDFNAKTSLDVGLEQLLEATQDQ